MKKVLKLYLEVNFSFLSSSIRECSEYEMSIFGCICKKDSNLKRRKERGLSSFNNNVSLSLSLSLELFSCKPSFHFVLVVKSIFKPKPLSIYSFWEYTISVTPTVYKNSESKQAFHFTFIHSSTQRWWRFWYVWIKDGKPPAFVSPIVYMTYTHV